MLAILFSESLWHLSFLDTFGSASLRQAQVFWSERCPYFRVRFVYISMYVAGTASNNQLLLCAIDAQQVQLALYVCCGNVWGQEVIPMMPCGLHARPNMWVFFSCVWVWVHCRAMGWAYRKVTGCEFVSMLFRVAWWSGAPVLKDQPLQQIWATVEDCSFCP